MTDDGEIPKEWFGQASSSASYSTPSLELGAICESAGQVIPWITQSKNAVICAWSAAVIRLCRSGHIPLIYVSCEKEDDTVTDELILSRLRDIFEDKAGVYSVISSSPTRAILSVLFSKKTDGLLKDEPNTPTTSTDT